MMFFRYILLFLFFYNLSFACQLCALQVPNVHMKVIGYEKDGYKYFDVNWEFEKEFSTESLLTYDLNGDGTYQEDELEEVKNSIEFYVKKNHYVTYLTNGDEDIDFDVLNSIVKYKDYKLSFHYTIRSKFTYEKNKSFNIKFTDGDLYFNFIVLEFTLNGYDKDTFRIHKKKDTVSIYFTDDIAKNIVVEDEKEVEVTPPKETGFMEVLKELLAKTKEYITDLLTDIKENNSIRSYIWLLIFSFAYGIIHALGPGHGKSLVGSYFLSKDRSVFKALNISLMIGVVHTFSAFLLTFTIYYVLKSVLSEYFTDIETIAIKLSAVVIIAIAFYLLFQKLKKPKIKAFQVGENQSFVKLSNNQHINTPTCACSACNTTSTDIGVILAAGIIPCPGTITIFTFTFGLGIYFVGFLSAIFMSLGMSFIIFIAAYLSIQVRGRTSSNMSVKKVLEYGSLVFILSLGIILLLF